jgi:hypothetical protein
MQIVTWLQSTLTFTWLHTTLSLIALFSGFVVMRDLLKSAAPDAWTTTFLVSSIATSATGFGFPFTKFLPSHGVGVIALVVLTVALIAAYGFGNRGAWRPVYAVCLVVAQFFNVFVAIAQAFAKVPELRALAPTQSEPPFAIAEGIALLVFVALAIAAARLYRYQPMTAKAA